ncbi:acyl-CoA dehydrogenase family protein [Mycobacterium sp.]|uniref:acyl-CoA dehydrogenase family protein n=1 Tax=Mycobacterium sp. TaxID=1785 RepID=UPI0012110ADB|nr:acyl-CoA dehydrogenase family protein [Mycobacterium sp.]TAM64464.1 MAG: acyl-CoA dehydrogenase [Mycobacterium sp.]
MGITLTDEQEELRDLVRGFLTEKAPSEAVRRWMDSAAGYDPELWRQMAQQLGLHGLTLPEQYGGAGYGLAELAVVMEEMGRRLLPSPFFATVGLAARTLLASGDEQACRRYLPGIAEGELTATVAVCDENGSWDLADIATPARRDGDDWSLSGTKMFVIDGQTADAILVIARADDELGLFAVDRNAAGITATRLDALDPTRRLARLDLRDCRSRRIGPAGDATPFLRRALDTANVALAAEQLGGAQACLDAAVEYAKVRVQFNRPIGSFQAIKHKCADVLVEIESARAAVLYAASLTEDAENASVDDEFPICAALVSAYCSAAYTRAAKENIQIHGGIGFTWEHDAHLYLKRAKTSELLFGAPVAQRARVAQLVGI